MENKESILQYNYSIYSLLYVINRKYLVIECYNFHVSR